MATPTSLPATFVAGNVLTAAQMNSLRGAFRILQVVQGGSTTSFATSSTGMVDVTNVTLSITPTSTTSKVLVIVTGVGGGTGSTDSLRLNIVRDSTAIGLGTGGTYNHSGVVYNHDIEAGTGFALTYLDSPATTSATTYKLQASLLGSVGVVVGRIAAVDTIRVPTTITALEVSA